MPDPYLIAHRVRGEPAFDIATRMTCAVCEGTLVKQIGTEEGGPCDECDGLGYWWIIPTSGHRAYPYWSERIEDLSLFIDGQYIAMPSLEYIVPPPDCPDHYPTASTPVRTADFAAILGLAKPEGKIRRR